MTEPQDCLSVEIKWGGLNTTEIRDWLATLKAERVTSPDGSREALRLDREIWLGTFELEIRGRL